MFFWGKKILILVLFLGLFLTIPDITFAQTGGKRIEINLTNQHLYAFLGDKLVYDFLASTGKWAPTPTGTFRPYWKTPSVRMVGGNKAIGTFYDLPNVPWDVFFYQGYAIHGAYWHRNFGHPMSHGCVNLGIQDAKLIYDFVDYSTPIIIYGVAPRV